MSERREQETEGLATLSSRFSGSSAVTVRLGDMETAPQVLNGQEIFNGGNCKTEEVISEAVMINKMKI